MAQDMQWPSEDEDFDAVTTGESKQQSSKEEALKPTAAAATKPPKTVSVAVSEPETQEEILPKAEVARNEDMLTPEDIDPIEAAFAEENEAEPAELNNTDNSRAAESSAAPLSQSSSDINEPLERVTPVTSAPKKPRSGNVARIALELLLALALIGFGFYTASLQKNKQDLKTEVAKLNANPQLAVQKQTDELISSVGALMTLPQGETPTVANVSDAAKAKEQSNFFANARNGDKVLMYVKAGQAILYRPSTNKIVLVAPLTFNNSTAATSSSDTTTTKTSR